jgi:cellulose synthase (UDP-forming)
MSQTESLSTGRGAASPWVERVFGDAAARRTLRLGLVRILIVTNALLAVYYISWRYTASINWHYWPFAFALLAAETYSFIDGMLFGVTMWRFRERPAPPPKRGDETVDVFITCYNEPVELVRETVRAAVAIHHPHRTWILDDGRSAEMAAMARQEGAGYITRTSDWQGRDLHAKAGNINNALFQTTGEFLLILDADQVPHPTILDHTLGYFRDERVSLVQTPQWFKNVPPGDPFGSQAPLFYGPIQQGKDGWNAAFFCGSNAVLRRDALLQGGVANYATDLRRRVRRALATATTVLNRAGRAMSPPERERLGGAIDELQAAVAGARRELRAGTPLQEVTWGFQREAQRVATAIVARDLAAIRAELAGIPGVEDGGDVERHLAELLVSDNEDALRDLAVRETSPIAAIETVRALLLAVDLDRGDEALPVMPMSTISVTEDMATAMRLHALGWKSVYHHEVLAEGLAPEDLRTALQQRLRWAQGTIQVFLRENPLLRRGLSSGQRLMYFATMWSYFSGFFAVIYLLAPVCYLFFGWMPIAAFSSEFFWRIIPFLLVNQLVFAVVGHGLPKWRGQQYSLALFPIWIKAVTSAVGNVIFHRKLGFVVTPKERQAGASMALIRPQLIIMALLVAASVWGLGRVALGRAEDPVAVAINVGWAAYDLAALSILLVAATWRPNATGDAGNKPVTTVADIRGRAGRGCA